MDLSFHVVKYDATYYVAFHHTWKVGQAHRSGQMLAISKSYWPRYIKGEFQLGPRN